MTSPAQPPLPLALIVDDDPTFRALSRMSLEQKDLRVEEASSGQAAIDVAVVTMPTSSFSTCRCRSWMGLSPVGNSGNCRARNLCLFLS